MRRQDFEMSHLSALAEVLLVLAAGNLLGGFVFNFAMPESVLSRTASDSVLAFSDGLLILLRLGSVGALGLSLLYWRSGLTPQQAGISRASNSLTTLLGQGALLGLVSGALVAVLFALQDFVGLGVGLPAWQTYSQQPINLAFLISVLATSVLIPPITEEIMTRAYMRTRMVEAYGPMAGVLLTALVFSLSHSRYVAADGMLLGFLLVLILNSFFWTYSAQKTGSIIPALVAHAVSNAIGTLVLFNVWWPLFIIVVLLIPWLAELRRVTHDFTLQWAEDTSRSSLGSGLLIIVVVLVLAMTGLSIVGRTTTLLILGIGSLAITLFSVVKAKRTKNQLS